MADVKLNSGSDDVGMKFKIIGISLTFGLNAIFFGISSSQVLPKKNHDGRINFADNWAKVHVMITFLTFGEAQILVGIVPNLIAFSLFLVAIG